MRHLKQMKSLASRLYRDEQGAETIEKLLILGAIVLPILIALVLFRNQISEWVGGRFEEVTDADDPSIAP